MSKCVTVLLMSVLDQSTKFNVKFLKVKDASVLLGVSVNTLVKSQHASLCIHNGLTEGNPYKFNCIYHGVEYFAEVLEGLESNKIPKKSIKKQKLNKFVFSKRYLASPRNINKVRLHTNIGRGKISPIIVTDLKTNISITFDAIVDGVSKIYMELFPNQKLNISSDRNKTKFDIFYHKIKNLLRDNRDSGVYMNYKIERI